MQNVLQETESVLDVEVRSKFFFAFHDVLCCISTSVFLLLLTFIPVASSGYDSSLRRLVNAGNSQKHKLNASAERLAEVRVK